MAFQGQGYIEIYKEIK